MQNPPANGLRTALSDAILFARQIEFTTDLSVRDCGVRLLKLSEKSEREYPSRLVTVDYETEDRARFELRRVGYTPRIGKNTFSTMRIVGSLTRDADSGKTQVNASARIGSFMPLLALMFLIVTLTTFSDLLRSTVDQWFGILLTVAFFAGAVYYTVGIGLQYRALRIQLYETLQPTEKAKA